MGNLSRMVGGTFPKNIYKPEPVRNFAVKENHVGPFGSDILWYKQTERHHVTFL